MSRMVDHVIDRLTGLANQVWVAADGPPVADITELLPTHRHAAQWCIATRDLDRGARLFTPFATALQLAFPQALSPAIELAALAPVTHPAWIELEVVALLARVYQGRFRDYRSSIATIRAATRSWDDVPHHVLQVVTYIATAAGDYDTAVDATQPRINDTPMGRVAAAGKITLEVLRGHGTPADVDRILGLMPAATAPFQRLTLLTSALIAAQVVAPERIGELVAATPWDHPDVITFQQWRHECLAEWHLVRHELDKALDAVHDLVAMARRQGELSGVIPPLVVHALVLQSLDRPHDAARISGVIPHRWALFHTTHNEAFRRWLEERLDTETRTRLAAEGSATELDELLTLAPKALALHQSTRL
jgi:hypothetical protein